MALPVTRLRRWLAAAAILMIVIVAGMYLYARWRVRGVVHEIPSQLGLDIQQTAEGFSISKSLQGRTQFTVSASKAIQFKQGGRAELHDVKIIVYGKDSSRFDRITGDDFEFDPSSGNVTAKGKVLIDLEANPEGIKKSDQMPPVEIRNPIHVETNGLIFNKNTGNASASGKVVFETPQATGSAIGVEYVSNTGTMTLRSSVEVSVAGPKSSRLSADSGVITKAPREVMLSHARMTRRGEQVRSEHATFFLRGDNTVERILAEGDVEAELHGSSDAHARADRAELMLTGARNQLTTAVLSGNVQLATQGEQPSEGSAGQVTLNFGGQQILQTVHAAEGVRLAQKRQSVRRTAPTPTALLAGGTHVVVGKGAGQDIEMTAPAMDFLVKDGRQLELAETSGPPQIIITQPATSQKTVVTAGRFTAKFTDKNRISLLHGEPDAKIVSSAPGQAERVSTSRTLDALFLPEGGISTITQAGGLTYVSGSQKAWAQRGTYTDSDQMLVLSGSPRVVDGGLTTTAQTIQFDRTTGDAVAEGNVKSTYSDLKAQPDGGMLASSDPIHVVSRSMTAHRSSAVAVYTGNARLWQNSNVVEAPTLEFDRDQRSLVADSSSSRPVKTVLVQVEKNGKVTPVVITSAHLTYNDADRKVLLDGGVTAKGSDATLTARQMTIFLVPRSRTQGGSGPVAPGTSNSGASIPGGSSLGSGQVEKIIAEKDVVITEPARRATGDRLVYTAADDKSVLTGGPPSIFDAEHGKITGDSLTFYRHDDRVLVEGKITSPAVTRTQVAR
ncbi:MAG: LPS export ABC transporter periplasmic protein LptC [Terriglobales bacterium]